MGVWVFIVNEWDQSFDSAFSYLCISFFILELSDWNFLPLFLFLCEKKYYFDNKRTRWISLIFFKKLILYCTTMSNVNRVRMRKFYISLTYFFSAFSFADSEDNMGREKTIFIPLYHIYLLTNIQTFICSFASQMTT